MEYAEIPHLEFEIFWIISKAMLARATSAILRTERNSTRVAWLPCKMIYEIQARLGW